MYPCLLSSNQTWLAGISPWSSMCFSHLHTNFRRGFASQPRLTTGAYTTCWFCNLNQSNKYYYYIAMFVRCASILPWRCVWILLVCKCKPFFFLSVDPQLLIWRFPEIGGISVLIHFLALFHEINHPFGGTPMIMETRPSLLLLVPYAEPLTIDTLGVRIGEFLGT